MESRKGLGYAIAAYAVWGLFPLYFEALKPAGPVEVLIHRCLWTAVFGVLLLTALQRLRGLRAAFQGKLVLAAFAIAVNWLVYVYGVHTNQVVETALGYFLNPLLTVILGVTILRERLRGLQWTAVGLGVAAGLVLTVEYGRLPWIAIALAVAFGTYGLLKKSVTVPALEGVTVETLVLTPIALGYMFFFAGPGGNTFLDGPAWHVVLMVLAGPVTGIPLLFYAGAAQRLPLTMMGLLQYITPVLQFTLGVTVFGEPMPPARLLGFGLVWVALAVLSFDGLRHARGRRGALVGDRAAR
ncbi:chloramphenicol-sensitive protein RarD [Kibdelosporangium banguiense]|uniref:Chloramphenicol-sensitive protein RarD n=1 Tax=Kibdelosporangium banguiense TaxID=1365924 RepID=A0ABS4TF61_9PSEU|nr:EamA family transporter RarD [Kibdelosporangium banguiense]MBP2323054.1 chloramphenicol-sensitive protein RarD [Kibdelosporangium banguiense]